MRANRRAATLKRMRNALTLSLLLTGPAFAGELDVLAGRVVAPIHSEACILAVVAGHMKATLTDAVARPTVRYASKTALSDYHADIENEYGPGSSAPYNVVTNMFLPKRNVIYMSDKAEHYRPGRYIDDSVAHEFAHYLQFFYQGEKDNPSPDYDMLETGAIKVQEWFRETYMAAGRSPCAAP